MLAGPRTSSGRGSTMASLGPMVAVAVAALTVNQAALTFPLGLPSFRPPNIADIPAAKQRSRPQVKASRAS